MSTSDEGTRESLYQRLEPLVGRANTELLMRNVREGSAEFATRADVEILGGVLRTEMAELRGEMKVGFAELGDKLHVDLLDKVTSQTRVLILSMVSVMLANAAGIAAAARIR